jgi:hypothetical protein
MYMFHMACTQKRQIKQRKCSCIFWADLVPIHQELELIHLFVGLDELLLQAGSLVRQLQLLCFQADDIPLNSSLQELFLVMQPFMVHRVAVAAYQLSLAQLLEV